VLDKLTIDDFSGRLGETFTVPAEGGPPIELELASATPGPGADSASERRAPFSLIFHGPLEPIMPQATYSLEHADLEGLAIFMVPIGPAGESMQYQAVFT
jgi:uncharacterized protein DUF6916